MYAPARIFLLHQKKLTQTSRKFEFMIITDLNPIDSVFRKSHPFYEREIELS